MYDVVIIGAGVIGSAAARELSRYQLKIAVVEQNSDIGEGTSKANSGIVHAGFDAKTGSLKAKLNVEGNRLMGELAKELDIPFRRNGSLVLCFSEEEREKLESLYENGLKNQVPELRILTGDEVKQMEPNISDEVVAALYAPTGGIVCPFTLTLALAENASVNGAEFLLEQKVLSIEKLQEEGKNYYRIQTDKEVLESRVVVNAAGVYADVFHNMVSSRKIKIIARKGEYCLFDKAVSGIVNKTIFQMPSALGKGILVTPTAHGNLMIGPNAADIEDKEGKNTTQQALEEIMAKAGRSVKNLPYRQVITSFCGLRAHEQGDDFIIGEAEDAPGFIDAAGIESPGLTCAPAIGRYISQIIADILPLELKSTFVSRRKGIHNILELPEDERKKLIAENPAYSNIICRCETVSEGEILEAIHRPLGARSTDGIKRRTRAGMGRCQAGFCAPKVMEILARELQLDPEDITKFGRESKYLIGINKKIKE
jgi:glycerol-3-phosphate dehydrogenase